MTKSEVKKLKITFPMHNFDKACEEAYERAIDMVTDGEYGHFKDEDFSRTNTTVVVEFDKYSHRGNMGGQKFYYEFNVWLERMEDDNDDE